MMIVSRILLMVMLLNGRVIFGMENWQKKRMMDIDTVLEAVINNDIEFIQEYIDNGGDINMKGDINNASYLEETISPCLKEIISLYLRKMTPLMVTALYGRPKAMKIFIKHGARLNWTNEFGDTALHMAARTMYTSLVRLLVKAGAQKDIQNKQGKIALDEANNSPLRSVYSNYKGKRGKNRSVVEMTRLLTNKVKFETALSIQAQINNTIAQVDDMKVTIPSKKFTKKSNNYYKPQNNNYIPNDTIYYSHYPMQMMHPGYYPTQMFNVWYYPMQSINPEYCPQTMHNEYYPMQMDNSGYYSRQLMHSIQYADVYPTTSDRMMQNYGELLGWSR